MSRQNAGAATTAAAPANDAGAMSASSSIHYQHQQQQQSAFTGQSLSESRHPNSTPVPTNNIGSVQSSGHAHGRLQMSSNGPLPNSSQLSNELAPDSDGSVLKSPPPMGGGGGLQFNNSGQGNSSAGSSLLISSSSIDNRPPMSNRMQANPPLLSNVLLSNNAQQQQQQLLPNSGNRPLSGTSLIGGPVLTSGSLTSTSQQIIAPALSTGPSLFVGPQSNRSQLGNGSPITNAPVQTSRFVNCKLPLNNKSQMSSSAQQISQPALATQLAKTSGLTSNIISSVVSSTTSGPQLTNTLLNTSYPAGQTLASSSLDTIPPTMKSSLSSVLLPNSGPLQTTTRHDITSPNSPVAVIGPLPHNAFSRQPMNSGPPVNIRPSLNSRPLINNGPPPNASEPLVTQLMPSGGPQGVFPPQVQQQQRQQSSMPRQMSSGAPVSGNPGSGLNSIPSIQKVDSTHELHHQFQNVNLTAGTPPPPPPPPPSYGYKSEPAPNLTSQMGNSLPQAYGTGNRPLDIRSSSSHLASSPYASQMNHQHQAASVTKHGFNKIWGMESTDIIQCRNILPAEKIEPPRIKLHQDLLDRVNCSPEIFRCTLTKIPETNSLLQKARLPLGILIHPFKDLNHLPVIQCNTIVRCRSCRTYINPFVYFVDSKRWKCNLCYKVNELPDEFQFDPATKSYGDPSRRPEIRTSTIEFIAPSEYMLRPPQPAVYIMVFDVSRLAVESGYLALVCNIITEELSRIPGDSRTQIGVLAVDSALHFFGMPDNVSQPQHMIMMDVEDVFLPCPDNLVVNLKEREELLKSLLGQLPQMFRDSHDTSCALGAALQAAYKLTSPTGGRVSVFQTCLPNAGPGSLQPRENPNARAGKDVPWLNPATDFYKRLALDCSVQQIAVDLFLLNCQYSDLASLSGICKFSGGCVYNVPLFQASRLPQAELLDRMLRRYLTRKIGFEAVMRVRCTRGIGVHTFHGNFFVRSTDLLSLPNVNPDAGFGMQLTIDESLTDAANVCFQAALLYTSSRGERRIRVHTLCLPTTANLSELLHSADQQCIVGLLAKMAVDRSISSSLSDAREALINAVVDYLSAYKLLQAYPGGGLLAPDNLKLLPMYIIALLKSRAFRFGISTRVDDRFYAMCQLKTLPLGQLVQYVYPDLYAIHDYVGQQITETDDGQLYPAPAKLHLSAEKLDSRGAFLLDHCDQILLYVGKNVHPSFCFNVLGLPSFAAIPEEMYGLPELSTPESERLRTFVATLQEEKPYFATLQVIRDDGHFRTEFTERLIEDRFENALSYYEFLQHVKTQVK